MKNTILISSYSKDKVIKNSKIIYYNGGPAYFIENVFNEHNFSFKNITKTNNYDIEIIAGADGETGKIIGKNIDRLKNDMEYENVIISTIGDEFLFSELKFIKFKRLFIDLQGFCRFYKKINYSKYFEGKELFVKATKKEAENISKRFLQKLLNNNTLIITNGGDGIQVFSQGKILKFEIDKLKNLKNTIGAGDTFFANFILFYLKGDGIDMSIKKSLEKTNEFLLNK